MEEKLCILECAEKKNCKIKETNWYLRVDMLMNFSSVIYHLILTSSPSYELNIIIFTQPLRLGRIWHKVNFFKQSLIGLNSEFSFS